MSRPASINQAFGMSIGGGVSNIPKSPARTDLSFCDSNLALNMRTLWLDHVYLTRMYIIQAVDDPKNGAAVKAAADRLIQNQVEIGDAVKPVFGNAGGAELTKLLKVHIVQAVDIIEAAKKGEKQKVNVLVAMWQQNGVDIARFLKNANPRFWELGELLKCMRDHLDLTVLEVQARIRKDYAADVRNFEMVKKQIIHKSDVLTRGISRFLEAKNKA